jgi:hypothetical protein
MSNELINIRVQNDTNSPLPVSLWGTSDITSTSANATTRYTWNVTFGGLTCGFGNLVVNGLTYTITLDGTLQGLLNQLNALNFGTFGGYTSGIFSYVFTADDTNTYGDLTLCDLPLIIEMDTGVPFNVSGDPTNVANWNNEFDLPANGTPFTSVSIVGDIAYLYGGQNIDLRYEPFGDQNNIKSVVDNAGAIISTQAQAFEFLYENQVITLPNCTYVAYRTFYSSGNSQTYNTQINLPSVITFENEVFLGAYLTTTFNFPTVQTVGANCFQDCTSATYFNLLSCTDLGGTTGDDGVFLNIVGQTITLVIPAALMTCNGGNPDGDIQYLLDNNNVTLYINGNLPTNYLLTQDGGFLLQEDGGYIILQEY